MKKIALLIGGKSSEREVSLKTGNAIFKALTSLGYNVEKVDPADNDFLKKIIEMKPDTIFNALHGTYGEDGIIQGVLELLGIPYTGSSVVTSALTMNKIYTKQILSHYNIPVIPYKTYRELPLETPFPLPVVLKPVNEGSSVGVYLIKNMDDFNKYALDIINRYGEVVVEPFIKGQEVQTFVLNGKAIGTIEIRPKREFYDYDAKYLSGDTNYIYPAEISEELHKSLKKISSKIYQILDCSGAVRIDFMAKDGKAELLEVNTLPGMTEASLVPKIAKAEGISFEELCEKILLSAKIHKK
ncbi:D-alanine--D-alanine ligase [bacterium]|nr:D-alanine--D-alanine ligase [bacterium]